MARVEQYDSSKTYAARRPIRASGVLYNPGDIVPRDAAPDERTYRKWFEGRMLCYDLAGPRAHKAAPSAPEAQHVPKGMVPADADRQQWADEYSKMVAERSAQAAPIPHANGHHVQQSEALMDAVAAQAVAQPPAAPAGNSNEGYIEPGGRGWCKVIFRGKEEKVRGFALASKKLDEMRAEAGLAPLSSEEKQVEPDVAPEVAPDAGAEPSAVPLRPGDQVVDGETGEITTVTEEVELPDEETPSAPWKGSNG